jgi:dihydrosphingosine 1-phosphate phosphatase
LPPVFRVIEALGLNLPRRFFKQASEYRRVPKQRDDDNLIPPVSEIPHMLTAFRRKRAISVGPQSEADAYEAMAYREKRRRDSTSSNTPLTPVVLPSMSKSQTSSSHGPVAIESHTTRRRSKSASIEEYKNMMGAGFSPGGPLASNTIQRNLFTSGVESDTEQRENRALFSNLLKPRVRYDVEVVTKLIVYSGELTTLRLRVT